MVLKMRFIGLLIAGCCTLGMGATVRAERAIVSIYKFNNEANAPDELFRTLRSRITNNIVNTRKFQVVDRENLKAILSEQNLANAGMTDAEDAPKSGKLRAAGYIIYGSVLSLGIDGSGTQIGDLKAAKLTAKVEIQLRFGDAETGDIIATKTIIATKSQSRMESSGQVTRGNVGEQVIEDAIREAAKKVTAALTDLAFPSKILKVSATSVMINVTAEATELGAIYEVWDVGEELLDPDTGESLGVEEELVGEIQITRTKPKYSLAKPCGGLELEFLEPGMIVRRLDEAVAQQRRNAKKKAKKASFKSRF